jgi:carnitine-CoA ligase
MQSMSIIPPTSGLTATDLVTAMAGDRGAQPFVIWAPFEAPEQTISYAAFAELVARCAGGLARRGIGRGDRVLVHLDNSPEALIARFACAWLGAICVGSNALAAGPEIEHYVASTGAKAAVTQPRYAEIVGRHAPELEWIAVTETDGACFDATPGTPSSDSFRALVQEPIGPAPVTGSDPCSIMFTSGTTSLPKGVVWTHANMVWGARSGAQQLALRSDDTTLLMLPLFHVVGLSWSLLPAMWSGGIVVLQPRFSASRYWPVAVAHRATIGAHVLFTTMALSKIEAPERHSFRQWTVGRADREAQARVRVPSFVPAWGMTEMVACPIIGDPWRASRQHTLGRASPMYDIRIVDDDRNDVASGQSGHLLVRGRRGVSIFRDYYDNPAANGAAFDSEGYFRTGDTVTLHEDGSIQFRDRASDVIKVGGEGMSPAEIEAVIRRVPGVAEVAVVGKPDEAYGQIPVAFVELAADAGASIRDAILAACEVSLAKFKRPRDVVIVDGLPRVGNAKISRAELRRRFEQG